MDKKSTSINPYQYIIEENSPDFDGNLRRNFELNQEDLDLLKEMGIYKGLPRLTLKNIGKLGESGALEKMAGDFTQKLKSIGKKAKDMGLRFYGENVMSLYEKCDFEDFEYIMRMFKDDDDSKDFDPEVLEERRALNSVFVEAEKILPNIVTPDGFYPSVTKRNIGALKYISSLIYYHVDEEDDPFPQIYKNFLMREFMVDCPTWGQLWATENGIKYIPENDDEDTFFVTPGWINNLIKHEIALEPDSDKNWFTPERGGIVCARIYLLAIGQFPNFNITTAGGI